MGNYRPKFLGLGGWTISSLHFYSKDAETTYFGYGGSKKAPAQTLTIAGDSVDYYSVGSENKSEIYLFDKISGLHRKTVNPRTGATLLTFSYDSGDRILKIEDAFGSQTKFQRNSSGVLLNVLAAKRQQTVTTFDSNGYLSAVTNPSSGQTYSMAYKQSGLLQSFKTPGEKIGNFTYDQNGLLISDLSSSGESTVLSASIPYYYPNVAGEGKAMTKKSAAGRSTVVRSQYDTITKDEYSVVVEANDFTRETVTGFRDQVDIIERTPSGLMFNHNISRQQDPWYTTLFNFETAEQFQGGGQSLYKSSEHNVTAGTTSNHKTSSPSIFQFSKDELVTWIDGKAWRNVYLSNSMQETLSSPLSRKVYRNLDRFGRVLSSRWDNYTPVNYIYDNYGRLIGITQGSRNNSIDYDSKGYVSAVTNARSEKVEFIYGPNGELIEMLLPDSRSVRFSYDSDGNRTSITTPSAFTHSFAYSGHGSISQYIPPNLTSSGQPSASYEYDNDGKIKTIKRPNSNLVAFNYSSTTHMLSGITTPEGSHSFSYNGPLITSTTSPDLYRQEYTYSGHLRNSETLMLATMSYGTVEKTFPSYLLGSVKVAGVSQMPIINYIYDNAEKCFKTIISLIHYCIIHYKDESNLYYSAADNF
ncbi:MAG: hypothetical protein EOO07_06320 [Chitinophagaceae bacterium]|nr:MAG: hypothetical protein EOO07_06320 [Chitinophagaceae bacterium]